MLSQSITAPGWNASQILGYDGVNRLESFTEGTGALQRGYGYDRYGNRWVSSNTGLTLSPLTATASTWFDPATNRISGGDYDEVGNLEQLNPFALEYDAESRVKSAASGNGSASYAYDLRCCESVLPIADTVSIGESAVMRVRDREGRLSRRVQEGTDPPLLDTPGFRGELDLLNRLPIPEFMSEAVGQRVRLLVYIRSDTTLTENVARSVAGYLKNRTGLHHIHVRIRPDTWFIVLSGFPYVYRLSNDLAPPTDAKWLRTPQVNCFTGRGRISCHLKRVKPRPSQG